MNPNEIKKALEDEIHLAEYVDSSYCSNVEVLLIKSALAYINQLEAEVDKLQVDLSEEIRRHLNAVGAYLTAKSDTINEFAERLKAKVRMNCFCEKLVFESDIDNLVKEMVGEQNV